MTDPTWSILIATLASRERKFLRLMDVLLPQAEETGEVEVIACHNNGEHPLGDIRQALMSAARGSYLSFIDDDDQIPDYFVPEMLMALWEDPDSVGFKMAYLESGQFIAFSYHSLHHEPHNDATGFYRDITHQQPVRSSIARLGDFRVAWPEDNAWRNVVRPHLTADNEVYIDDKIMYYYHHSWSDSVQGVLAPHTYTPRPGINSTVFRWLEMTLKLVR